jgi:hypothetical protein
MKTVKNRVKYVFALGVYTENLKAVRLKKSGSLRLIF